MNYWSQAANVIEEVQLIFSTLSISRIVDAENNTFYNYQYK